MVKLEVGVLVKFWFLSWHSHWQWSLTLTRPDYHWKTIDQASIRPCNQLSQWSYLRAHASKPQDISRKLSDGTVPSDSIDLAIVPPVRNYGGWYQLWIEILRSPRDPEHFRIRRWQELLKPAGQWRYTHFHRYSRLPWPCAGLSPK